LGKEWRSEDLAAEVLKDRAYFEASGKGGVTFSGGEAAMQADFAAEVFSALSDAGIHTALDTAGFGPWEAFDRMLPYVDLVLFDIKEIDPERHRLFTGAGNAQALRTLSRILDWTGKREPEIWIRTPLIPGATAREENIRGIGAWLSEHRSPRITRWELCAFNDLCGDKYERLGIDWDFAGTGLLSLPEMEGFLAIARGAYTDPAAVLWTGPTKA
jgi:pyruvate formate lyase activating enzyme